jgi:hypothetical protein
MRAAIFERQGLDNLNVKEDVQQPTITDHDVLIKVKSTGANLAATTGFAKEKIPNTWKHIVLVGFGRGATLPPSKKCLGKHSKFNNLGFLKITAFFFRPFSFGFFIVFFDLLPLNVPLFQVFL